MLNSLIVHNIIPHEMLSGTIVPIPKNKRKSLNDSSNYRSITLSSIVGKLMDNAILIKHQDSLKSSDYQFGFKRAHSTTQCTFVVKETVEYYRRNHNDVYAMFLDASQAFDRVNFVKLFKLLIKKGLCQLITCFLLKLYTKQCLKIRWGTSTSEEFKVCNGVKQGGVLSPLLFSIYMDELIERLKRSGVGCYIGNMFMGAFCYADDCNLLAPTLFSMKNMLDIVSKLGKDFDMKFNPTKSQFIVFSDDKSPCNITFDDASITSVECANHLGCPISVCNGNEHILQCKHDFISKANCVISNFASCTVHVKYKLLKSFCLSLFGCVLWNLSSKSVDIIYTAWRVIVRKLLNVSYKTHSLYLPLIIEDWSIQTQIHRRYVKFFNSVVHSTNRVIHMCKLLVVNGSGSSVCKSLNYRYIRSIYNINGHREHSIQISSIKDMFDFDEQDKINVENIKCLLDMRYTYNSCVFPSNNCFTTGDLNTLLEFLCVKMY